MEVRPSLCSVAGTSGLLAWLLKRLRAKMIFEPNKLYASEILAICVQVIVGSVVRWSQKTSCVQLREMVG